MIPSFIEEAKARLHGKLMEKRGRGRPRKPRTPEEQALVDLLKQMEQDKKEIKKQQKELARARREREAAERAAEVRRRKEQRIAERLKRADERAMSRTWARTRGVSEARHQDRSEGEPFGGVPFCNLALPDGLLDAMEDDRCTAEERWDQAHPQEVREDWATPDLPLDPIDEEENDDAIESD